MSVALLVATQRTHTLQHTRLIKVRPSCGTLSVETRIYCTFLCLRQIAFLSCSHMNTSMIESLDVHCIAGRNSKDAYIATHEVNQGTPVMWDPFGRDTHLLHIFCVLRQIAFLRCSHMNTSMIESLDVHCIAGRNSKDAYIATHELNQGTPVMWDPFGRDTHLLHIFCVLRQIAFLSCSHMNTSMIESLDVHCIAGRNSKDAYIATHEVNQGTPFMWDPFGRDTHLLHIFCVLRQIAFLRCPQMNNSMIESSDCMVGHNSKDAYTAKHEFNQGMPLMWDPFGRDSGSIPSRRRGQESKSGWSVEPLAKYLKDF